MEEQKERKKRGKRKLVFAEGSLPFFPSSPVPFRIPLIPPPLSTRYLRSNPLLLPSLQPSHLHASPNQPSIWRRRVSARSKEEHAKEAIRSNGERSKMDDGSCEKSRIWKKVVYHVKDENVQTGLGIPTNLIKVRNCESGCRPIQTLQLCNFPGALGFSHLGFLVCLTLGKEESVLVLLRWQEEEEAGDELNFPSSSSALPSAHCPSIPPLPLQRRSRPERRWRRSGFFTEKFFTKQNFCVCCEAKV